MSASQLSTQSAVARRTAEAELRRLIAKGDTLYLNALACSNFNSFAGPVTTIRQAPTRSLSEGQMYVPKTKPTAVSVERHIAAIANEEQRKDARSLVALMRKVTRQEPKMWGPSIVGFGSFHYKYASGHEGDTALAAFAARGRELVVYIAEEFEGRDALLAKLGEHKTGKVCVYIRRLANVDLKVLETLVARSVADAKRRYPKPR